MKLRTKDQRERFVVIGMFAVFVCVIALLPLAFSPFWDWLKGMTLVIVIFGSIWGVVALITGWINRGE